MSKEDRIFFMLHTRAGRFLLKTADIFAPILGALLTMFVIWNVETRFFPVIKDWTLYSVERDGDHFVLDGELQKVRACELVATSIVAVPSIPLAPSILVYQIRPYELNGANAPTGRTTWGPWRMPIPRAFSENIDRISYIKVVGHHRCHALWTQETVYGRVPIERLR